jgi:hypothetical protein
MNESLSVDNDTLSISIDMDNDTLSMDFDKSYRKLMNTIDFNIGSEPNDSPVDRSLSSLNIPDKWDVAAGLIMTGIISVSIIGLSSASYYIVIGLYNANILCYVGAIISASEKSKIINRNRDKIIKLLEGELKWLLSENLFYLVSSELKDMHFKIKTFLMNHFENDEDFIKHV